MDEFLRWTDALLVGDSATDAAHRSMVQLANTFMSGLAERKSEKILHSILNHLIDVAKEHFRAEERALKGIDADSFAHHRAEHGRLLNELRMLDNGFAASKLEVDDVLPFFRDWVFNHIENMDLKAYKKNKPAQ